MEEYMQITFYSTGCPKCKILKTKLDEKNVQYEVCSDTEVMLLHNFKTVPMLDVDGKVMNFNEAIQWTKEI
jgi:glutaredoxin